MSYPPVQRVDSFENIYDKINFCISNDVNKKKYLIIFIQFNKQIFYFIKIILLT